jgi:hypothetical protein
MQRRAQKVRKRLGFHLNETLNSSAPSSENDEKEEETSNADEEHSEASFFGVI